MSSDLQQAREALAAIPPGIPRDEWIQIGTAALAAGITLDELIEWSAHGENFKNERDVRSAFKNIKPNGGITAATLFHHAAAHGWKNGNGQRKATRPKARTDHNPVALWGSCTPATASHPYIERKLGMPDGLRTCGRDLKVARRSVDGALVIPLRRLDGHLHTVQLVCADGTKLFLPGARLVAEACHIVGPALEAATRAFVTEGIGQAWSAHQATRAPAVVCFGAGRMRGVAEAIHARFPKLDLVVVSDRGKEADAADIARAVSGMYIELPQDKPANYDLNDYHVEVRDLHAVAELLATAKRPDPATDGTLLAAGFWVGDARVTLDLPYIVKGGIYRGQLIVGWGIPGSGKSFIAAEMLSCIGAGVSWRGRRVKRGPTLYIVAESNRAHIQNRLCALTRERPELAAADVFVVPLALDLLHARHGDVDRVIATANAISQMRGEIALITVDTLSVTFGGGDENGPDMGLYVRNLKHIIEQTGAAVLVIHHCGKDEARGMRGHSALLGALDAELVVEVGNDSHRILRTGKVRDGDAYTDLFAFTLRPVELGRDSDGDAVTTCIIESLDDRGTRQVREQRNRGGLGRHQKTVLRAIEEAGGRIPRMNLAAKLKVEGMPRQRVSDAIASLLESGMLVAHNDTDPPEVSVP